MVFKLLIRQSGRRVMLHPLHTARGEVGRRADAIHVGQDFERDVGYLECEGRFAVYPTANREEFSADFPHVRVSPLDDVRGGGKSGAESVEFVAGHSGFPCIVEAICADMGVT